MNTDRKQKLENYLANYKERLSDVLSQINVDVLERVTSELIRAFKSKNTIYIIGNGGSAATASHMQADFGFFVRYFSKFRPVIIALTDNVPIITAVGNDNAFEDVFLEQLRGRFNPNDILIAISASGNSPNLVKAVEYANKRNGITISLTGFDGGKLKDLSKICLFTPNKKGDYGTIEDTHMIINHVIINYLSQDEEFLAIPEN